MGGDAETVDRDDRATQAGPLGPPERARGLDRDPTGAGDAFSTAYIVGRSAGFGPVGAARRATAVVASLLSE